MKRNKINLKFTNKDRSIFMTMIIIFFSVISILIPLLFVNYIPQSLIGNFILLNLYMFYITFPLLLYFIFTGVYFCKINIDAYVVQITSFRTLSGLFSNKNDIDIAHNMLKEYKFFSRPFSFNKTLMLKIEKPNRKIIAKRFNISLITLKEQDKIASVLQEIINKENEG